MNDPAQDWRIVINLRAPKKIAKRITRIVAAALPRRVTTSVDVLVRDGTVALERASDD